jgi:rhomboid family protein
MSSYNYTTSGRNFAIGQPWTPAIKRIIIINVIVFLLQMVFSKAPWLNLAALQIPEVFNHLRLWQLVTYMFLHGGFWHLAFNMFALWMFGCEVETTLGTRRFVYYYFATGIGAGICVSLVGNLAGEHSLTVGASGAIFGILMAYGILFSEKVITLLIFFILPVRMKAKTMVLLFGAFEFVAGVGNAFGQVSHLAHLSGLLIGYLFFLWQWPELLPQLSLFQSIKMWHLGKKVRKIDPEDQVDAILEKISRDGIGSISMREREILNQASKRKRNNSQHRDN